MEYDTEYDGQYNIALNIYKHSVANAIRDADAEAIASNNESYKGVTKGFINRMIGDSANEVMTAESIKLLDHLVVVDMVPPRFTFIQPEVVHPDRHLIGTVAEVPKYKPDDPKTYPVAAWRKQY